MGPSTILVVLVVVPESSRLARTIYLGNNTVTGVLESYNIPLSCVSYSIDQCLPTNTVHCPFVFTRDVFRYPRH